MFVGRTLCVHTSHNTRSADSFSTESDDPRADSDNIPKLYLTDDAQAALIHLVSLSLHSIS